MWRILTRVLIAAIGYGTAAAHCQAPQAGTTTITFQSSTYSDFRQLLAREAPTPGGVTVKAYLGFPEQVRDRYPAVIVVHTIAGYRDDSEGYAATELRKAGFATLTYDSFAARGTTGPALSGSSGYLPIGVADAYAALRFLSGEPRIDANRIAIIGFSYGGEVAHLAAFETLRATLDSGGRFAAHVAFYPGGSFGAIAEPGAYTGSPVLMLLGGKDDNLPVTKIQNYLTYARAAGAPAPIEIVVYPSAYHAWTVPGLTTARFYPDYVSTKKCPLILLGPKRPASLIDGEAKPFDPTAFGACVAAAPGYSMGFDAAVRAQSTSDAVRFLRRNLGP
jgi:dienelactone hydrolase